MGFMDKMKGTAKQAMSPGGQMAERDKITKINQSGFAWSTALPARSAAARQSVEELPSPHVAGPCGSLCRSAPMTVGLPR